MKPSNDLQLISDDLQAINETFNKIVQPFRAALWNYCKYLTGSPWDAEDLLQETLLKAFSSLSKVKQSMNPKSYLFRVAHNTWLDYCRKNKVEIEELKIENVYVEDSISYVEVSEAIETLIHHLSPKQASVVLLMEVYKFTSNETAEIIGTSEGAVYSLLNRARKNLKNIPKENEVIMSNISLSREKEDVIQCYMESFVKGDFKTIGTLLADYATNEVVGQGIDIGKTQIRKNSMGDWASSGSEQHLFYELINLFGKQAIVYTKQTENGTVLWDITTVEIEEGYIVSHKSYYFCKDFLLNAANELNIKLAEDKELFGVQW